MIKNIDRILMWILHFSVVYEFWVSRRVCLWDKEGDKVVRKGCCRLYAGVWCGKIPSVGDSVTSKKSPNVYKTCPKLIALEKKRFWHLYKNCPILWVFGQNNSCRLLWKVTQSTINQPIWSHCRCSKIIYFIASIEHQITYKIHWHDLQTCHYLSLHRLLSRPEIFQIYELFPSIY